MQSSRIFHTRGETRQIVPCIVPTFASHKTIGGNAHENWCLLRLLPLMVGFRVHDIQLHAIVELCMSPTHTGTGLLDSLIADHRYRFFTVFPQGKLIPKHHFAEHYLQLIKAFGPLVLLWTMRFEAKHHFFKKLVRQTCCFRNIVKSKVQVHVRMFWLQNISTLLHTISNPNPNPRVP